MLSRSALLLLLTLAVTVSAAVTKDPNAPDPCTLIAKASSSPMESWTKFKPSQIRACYDSFPYDKSIAQRSLSALRNVLQVYAFTDWMNNSPNPGYQTNVDLLKKLEVIEATDFPTDRAFHETVQDAVASINDGHTAYNIRCYSQFGFFQPFFLVSSAVDRPRRSGPSVFIHSYDDNLQTRFKLDLQRYVGARVMEIDGVPVYDALRKYADSIGYSKDKNTRLTRVFAYKVWDKSSNSFKGTRGLFASRKRLPENDAVVYTLELTSGETVKVNIPWAVKGLRSPNGWIDKDSYWKGICKTGGAGSPFPSQNGISDDDDDDMDEPITITPGQVRAAMQGPVVKRLKSDLVSSKSMKGLSTSREGTNAPIRDPYYVSAGPGWGVFMLQDSPIGILKMADFPRNLDGWLASFKIGIQKLKKRGAEQLILDFSENTGGAICAAYAMAEVFVGESVKPFLTDIRLGGLMPDLFEASKTLKNNIFNLRNYTNPQTGAPFKDLSWVTPGKVKTFANGRTSPVPYTELFTQDCSDVTNVVRDFFKGFEFWDYKNVVFLTNGNCMSSCALLHNILHENVRELRTVAVYSPSNDSKLQTVSSVAGGMGYRTAFFASDLISAGLIQDFDVSLPLAGDISFAMRAAYSNIDPNVPLEYRLVTADYVLPYSLSNAMNMEQLWLDVATMVWG